MKMFRDQKKQFNHLLFLLTVFVASSILFLEGFFQVSNSQTTGQKLNYSNTVNILDENTTLKPPQVIYDQIVLMIVDAWRADYPNATNMPYAHNNACDHLKIKVDIPTVTMPRIKSITTGTISNFIDIVLNLGHTTKLEESILHRVFEKNKKVVFAGDRTWLQLFPDIFFRAAANTDSFYVNDFYEGDLNVTKTLKKELNYTDWHLMILHFLGLDHIGHVEGSHSEKIYVKLIEMDNIVKYIEANMRPRSLLLLTGDHGMRNGGSHGGSDVEELYVPLMAFAKNCPKRRSSLEYNQIDMTATLAVLLDVKIPQTSIGRLIPELLERFSKEEQLYLLHYNTLHLVEQLKAKFTSVDYHNEDFLTWYRDAKTSHKEFILSQASNYLSFEEAKQNYGRVSKKISQILSKSLVQYNIPYILIALLLAILCAIKMLMTVFFEFTSNSLESSEFSLKKLFACLASATLITLLTHFFHVLVIESLITLIIFICSIAMSIYFIHDILKIFLLAILASPPLRRNRKLIFKLSIPSALLSLFLCHTLSLASTSFIEEEHQTWYYLTPSLFLFLTFQNIYINVKNVWRKLKPVEALCTEFWNIRYVFIVMLSLIGCRRLNQTGDKWRNLTDIGDVLTRHQNHFYLMFTLLTGLASLLLLLKKYNTSLDMCFCSLALFCVFLYRQMYSCSFLIIILFWSILICIQLRHWRNFFFNRKNFEYSARENLIALLQANLMCSVLISALLHRPHNVVLLPALLHTLEKSYILCDNLYIKENRLFSRSYVLVLKTVITIFVGNMFYFFQGNSNSLATIDVNPGYIGLTSYNPLIVGPLITINTFGAPINAFLYLMWHMFSTQRNTFPTRQEKELTNEQLFESTEEDLYLVYSLFTTSTIMPVTVYWCFLVGFRYHLFIYSVFAPKAIYECFQLLVFYLNFIFTYLYFRLFLVKDLFIQY